MKLTRHIISGAVILAACSLASCEDELDKFPLDKTTPESFFKTPADLAQYTNKFYESGTQADEIFKDAGDIMMAPTANEAICGLRIIPESGGHWSWGTLRDINFYLSRSGQCSDADARAYYDAIARFFRAVFYYRKVAYFGDVPWYDKVLESDDPDLYKPRDSREFVMQKVLEDIDYAIANLPTTRDTYRLTRWTALALKTRVTLFEGTFRKYHGLDDWEKYLTICAEAGSEFINQSGYTISRVGAEPYFELFHAAKCNPDEVILARAYDKDLDLRQGAHGWIYSNSTSGAGYTVRLAQAYLMKDGTYFSSVPGYDRMTINEEYKNRDPRMTQTICCPGTMRDGVLTAPNLATQLLGYQPRKYDAGRQYDGVFLSYNDLPQYRAAEVYLNYAEAKAELGTLTQDDIDRSIKPIRDRVGMPNLNLAYANEHPDPWMESPKTGFTNVTGPNKGVILEIRRERTVELVQEGLRYNDIMRWKAGAVFDQPFLGMYFPGEGEYDLDGDGVNDVLLYSGSMPASSCATKLQIGRDLRIDAASGRLVILDEIERHWNEERDYLWPIPMKERRLTNGALAQNPGWDDGLSF